MSPSSPTPPAKYAFFNFSATPHPKHPPNLTLHPVTSPLDIPILTSVNDRALNADHQFKQWMAMFTERSDWDTTMTALTEALADPEYYVIKAVVLDGEGEKIVGFVQWFCGWIVLEQVDPFAKKEDIASSKPGEDQSQGQNQSHPHSATDIKDPTSRIPEELSKESTTLTSQPAPSPHDLDRARRLKKGERKYIETRNQYIGTIRGKRHMFIRRIMVLPEYQGMGIGRALMTVVTDEADRLKIVCWLFARPGGVRLYEKCGYRVVGVTDMDEKEEEFECSETSGMLRGIGGG